MRYLSFGLGLAVAAAPLVAASAQSKAKTESVTVAASRPAVQVLPDRTVYALDKNIQSATGSLSDVLRDLPSVDVDIQGNVALRGDSNVTILIDGKVSPLLAGNRADALQQIPANLVERIEVITNPSAEFRAEGSGGIINIVLRKDKELVSSGIVRVNAGSEGRLNVSASGNLKLGRVRLHGAYGERRDVQRYAAATVRSDGTNPRSSQDATGKTVFAGRYAMLSASIGSNSANEVVLGGAYNRFGGHSKSREHNVSFQSATDIARDGLSHWTREGAQASIGYRHRFAQKDEEFNLDLSRHSSWGNNGSDYTSTDNNSGEANYWQSRRSRTREAHTEVKSGYTLPLGDKGKFKAGYALQIDSNLTDNHGLKRNTNSADWNEDPSYTNYFVLDRTIQAGYLSYEQKFGRFGVMGGLRLEHDDLSTDLKTTGETHTNTTLGFYPSLHLSYVLTDTQQFRLSYSRRMNRPNINALNPARYSNDAFNVWAGNPYLKPEQVDSYEASYRYTGEKSDAVITGYYRATYKGITNVYRYLSDTVLLTTMDNLAHRMASGAEANFHTDLFAGLSLRTTGSLAYNEFNPGTSGLGRKQSGLNWNVRGGLDWQATADDLVQLNANYSGKQRFAQGYRRPTLSGDLSVKHNFGNGLAALGTLNNLFNSASRRNVLDTPTLHQVDRRTMPGRVLYFGLVYTFGGAKDTGEPGHEAESTPPGAAVQP